MDVRANAVFNYVKAGLGFASDSSHPLSEIRIHAGATLTVNKRLDLGASSIVDPATFYNGKTIEGDNTLNNVNDGRANLTFLGGMLGTPDSADTDNIKIGLGSQLCRLQGWGGIDLNRNKAKILYKNTQFIADGGGAERTLDLGFVTYAIAQARNGADGTNGWYAVNKGKLVYPRTFRNSAAYTLGIGDDREISEANLDVVNSLRVTGKWDTSGHVIKAALYAEGRSDIPAGLDASADVLGVWEIWAQQAYNNATRINTTDNTVTIRYDHQKLKSRWTPVVYRSKGGDTGWQRVADAEFDLAARRVKLTDETIGTGTWYAVVANPPGLTIVVR